MVVRHLLALLLLAASPGPKGLEGVPIPQVPVLQQPQAVRLNQTIDGVKCQQTEKVVFHIHAHLVIYVNGKQRQVPFGVGIGPPLKGQNAPAGPFVTGVLISYSMGRPMSMVDGCSIVGTREGIATHSSAVSVMNNHVVDTTERGILLGEMSMDMASHNTVESAKGIGIICMDHSMCEIEHNTVAGAQVDGDQNATRGGVAIEAFYYAEAKVRHNTVVASPGGVRAFDNSIITR